MIRNIELTLEAHATRKYIVRARIISMAGRSVDAIAKADSLDAAQQSAIEAAKERLAGEFGAEAMPTPAPNPSPQKEPPLQREAPTDPLASTKGPAKVWGDQTLIINGHEIPPQPWALEVCDEVDGDCNDQASDVKDNDCDGKVDEITVEQPDISGWTVREQVAFAQLRAGKAVVANASKHRDLIDWSKQNGRYILIDRRTKFGNPYKLSDGETREDVCRKYDKHLATQQGILDIIDELAGNVLVCHCSPLICHGDTLAALANGERSIESLRHEPSEDEPSPEPATAVTSESIEKEREEARVIVMNAVARRDELNMGDLKRITQQLHGTTSSRDLSAETMRELATQIRNGPTDQDKQVAGMQREFLRAAGPTANLDDVRAVADTAWAVVLIEEVIVEWQHNQHQRGAA